MKFPVLIFVVFYAAVLMAFEDLGPLKTARNKYPQIFKTGSINIVTINKIPCYVFSGEAEQAFSGDFAESESELYEEATLSAKSNFYEFLSKKNKKATISMSGCSVLYQYNDKKVYNVILFVPKENVAIKINESAPDLIKKDTQPASAPKVEQKISKPIVKTQQLSSTKVINKHPSRDAVEIAKTSSTQRRIAKFQNRIKNNPDDIISIIALGDLYKKDRKYYEAIKLYRSAIKKLDQDKFFDETEKIRVIFDVAILSEKTNKKNMALKYYHYLLRHKCSSEQRKTAVAAISRLRLKMLD